MRKETLAVPVEPVGLQAPSVLQLVDDVAGVRKSDEAVDVGGGDPLWVRQDHRRAADDVDRSRFTAFGEQVNQLSQDLAHLGGGEAAGRWALTSSAASR